MGLATIERHEQSVEQLADGLLALMAKRDAERQMQRAMRRNA